MYLELHLRVIFFNITKWDENRLERYHIVILVVLLWFFIPDSLLIDLGKLDDAERL